VNLKWLAEYCATSVAMIERSYGRFLAAGADHQFGAPRRGRGRGGAPDDAGRILCHSGPLTRIRLVPQCVRIRTEPPTAAGVPRLVLNRFDLHRPARAAHETACVGHLLQTRPSGWMAKSWRPFGFSPSGSHCDIK